MDTQSMCITAAESVTGDVKSPGTPKITKEEVQKKSDAELLQMIQQAQGHTGKGFSEYMNCDFSYTYLTGVIRDRGYENGWHKTSEGSSPVMKPTVIRMKKSEEGTTRKSFIIDEDVAEEWKSFNRNVPFPSVTLGCALRRFMEDYHSGRITFQLEI